MHLSRLERSNGQESNQNSRKSCDSSFSHSRTTLMKMPEIIPSSLGEQIFRPDAFTVIMLGLFIFRGKGKINTQSWAARIKKVFYLPLFLPCLLHDQAIHNRNAENLCSTVSAVTFFFLSNKNPDTVVTNQLTISLFDLLHWGERKQIQAKIEISQIKDLSTLRWMTGQKERWVAVESENERSSKVRFTGTNTVLYWTLMYESCKYAALLKQRTACHSGYTSVEECMGGCFSSKL